MDTWGFSGPAFLAVYVGLLALTAAAVVADRARVDRRGCGAGVGDYDVAVLNGEAGLAASVALLALDRAGAVALADRMVRELAESQDLDLGSMTGGTLSEKGLGMEVMLGSPLASYGHPVEAEVYKAVERSSSRRASDILAAAAGLPAIAVVRRRLPTSASCARRPRSIDGPASGCGCRAPRAGRRWRAAQGATSWAAALVTPGGCAGHLTARGSSPRRAATSS